MKRQLSVRDEKEIEQMWDLRDEGMKLLDLIAAEFESDPMSVQCFDLRTVESVKRVAKAYRPLASKHNVFAP